MTPPAISKRNRIVFFTPGLHEVGGAAQRSRLLAAGVAARGWDVRVVARSSMQRRFHFRRGDARLLEVPGFGRRRLGALLYMLCALPAGLIWGRRARAFVAIQLASPAVAAGLCAGVWRRPYVAFTSTTGELSEVSAVDSARTAGFRRRLLKRARFLIAQTPEAALEFTDLVPRDRVAVLPTPVEQAGAMPLNGEPRVLFLGRLCWEKNLPTLLEAWRAVVDVIPAATLTLVGEGGAYRSVEDELRASVEADPKLRRSVRFAGWQDDVSPYVATHDVFVLPSRSEGMSNALLEACARSRVVVASDIPGNRAVLGDNYDLLVPPGDPETLGRALVRALSDQPTRASAVAQIEQRMSLFDLDTVVGRLLDLIGSVENPTSVEDPVSRRR